MEDCSSLEEIERFWESVFFVVSESCIEEGLCVVGRSVISTNLNLVTLVNPTQPFYYCCCYHHHYILNVDLKFA